MNDYLPSRTIQREVDLMWRLYMQELERLKETHKEAHKGEKPCMVAEIIRHSRKVVIGKVEVDNVE